MLPNSSLKKAFERPGGQGQRGTQGMGNIGKKPVAKLICLLQGIFSLFFFGQIAN